MSSSSKKTGVELPQIQVFYQRQQQIFASFVQYESFPSHKQEDYVVKVQQLRRDERI
jgi:hypothetical protein